MASTRKRIEIIDVAKAITIFLVILGHTTANTDTVMYRRVLYAFHMPLFFLLAGLSIKPRAVTGAAQWLDFIRKNVLALVVPYIVWGLVYAPFEYASFRFLAWGSWAALTEMGTLTSLWYLPCFFIARILTQAFVSLAAKLNVPRTDVACGVAAVLSFLVGMLLPYLEFGYPWCLDVALVASIIVLPLSMALNAVIERFIPELLGQFPSWPASLRDARARS